MTTAESTPAYWRRMEQIRQRGTIQDIRELARERGEVEEREERREEEEP